MQADRDICRVAARGTHSATVFTPHDASAYFEQLRNAEPVCDGGASVGRSCDPEAGNPCPGGGECADILWQGNVPSG